MLSLAQAWVDYAWTRLRRMDYWNPKYAVDGLLTNAPAKMYRWNAPGLRVGRPEANLSKLDEKLGTSNFSVRYFHREQIKRDTTYYPDTPLSVNHAIMKGKPLRSEGPQQPANMPQINYFGAASFGTPGAMGIKKINIPVDEKPAAEF